MAGARPISRYRLPALGALLVVLAGIWWVVRDRPEPPPLPAPTPLSVEDTRLLQVGAGLMSVRPGMARADVESHLGWPDPKDIGPAERFNGLTVFRVRYLAYLAQSPPTAPQLRGHYEVELIYDATRTGHPLLEVKYTPRNPPTHIPLPEQTRRPNVPEQGFALNSPPERRPMIRYLPSPTQPIKSPR